jgi:hypothetical protein
VVSTTEYSWTGTLPLMLVPACFSSMFFNGRGHLFPRLRFVFPLFFSKGARDTNPINFLIGILRQKLNGNVLTKRSIRDNILCYFAP